MSNSIKNQNATKDHSSISDYYTNWVDSRVLSIQSTIVDKNQLENIITNANLLQPNTDSSTVSYKPCKTSDRVCMSKSEGEDDFFFVYESFFTEVGLRLPFSDFQLSVLNEIKTAPSQLHVNSWSFIRCFELLCQSCSLVPTVSTFFYFFKVKEEDETKMSWVKIHTRKPRYKILILDRPGRNFPFKEAFFRVEGRSDEGSTTPFFMNENGTPKFPLYWSDSVCSPDSPTLKSLSRLEQNLVIKIEQMGVPRRCSSLLIHGSDRILNSDTASEGHHLIPYQSDRDSEDLEEEEEAEQTVVNKRKRIETPPDVKRRNYIDVARFVKSSTLRIASGAEFLMDEVEMRQRELHSIKKDKDKLESDVSRLVAELDREKTSRIKAEEHLARCKGELVKTQKEVQSLLKEKDRKESGVSKLVAVMEWEKEKFDRLRVEEELARCKIELTKAQKESKYIEGCLFEKWKKSITESFQNAIEQVRLGCPGLNLTSITLDPFKVVKGKELVDKVDSII